ncbi:trypsin-1-like [Musca autumnalis]|uniref:trypsin-1-like n=1 Tax=Musca autumnalis TaxID=221902 RepID=UPI003CEB9EE3
MFRVLSAILLLTALVVDARSLDSSGELITLKDGEFPMKPRPDGRIVGGQRINITEAPYQISLQTRSMHICGGSIISKEWILTAAHCTYGREASELKVRLGSTDTDKDGDLIDVAKLVQHEKFNIRNVDYDYSLIKLSKEIELDETKKIVDLPKLKEDYMDGTVCLVTGWGNTKNRTDWEQLLRQTKVPIFNQKECSRRYGLFGGVTERMLCAGYAEGGKDACQGDSGGPLVTEDGVLVGVVSWGYGCARPNYPGIYSRVAYVRDWIMEHAGV